MTNGELLQHIRRQLTQCAGFESDDLSIDRERALDYYLMRPNGTEVAGRSTAVSGDVSAMVDSSLAAMMEAFSDEHIVELDSLGPEDEDQAQLESDALSYYVMSQAGGRWQLAQAIKEVLRLRNGWMKVWVEEERRPKIEEYRNVTPEALLELTERPGLEVTILKYDPTDGYLKTRTVTVRKRFCAEAVSPGNIVYPKAYDGCDFRALQAIPIIAERHIDTRSHLIAIGFDRAAVERIPEYRSDRNPTEAARNPRRDSSLTPGLDTASQLVEWWECYVLVDSGYGLAERRKVCCDAGFRELFQKQPANLVPYATGQCFIAPHRLTGVSLWDKLRQTQDINTDLTRALLDNVQATTRNRIAYLDGKANVDDIGDGRVNGAIRVKASVGRVTDAVMPFAVPDTSAGIREAIQFMRNVRTELGGASLDMQAGELQMTKQVGSMGLDRAFSVAEQLAAHMTQNVADTLIRSVFLLAHATLREHYAEPIPIKRGGRWAYSTPAEWPERECVTIKVGMSPGERTRQQASLDKLLQVHLQLEQLGMGGILTNLEGFYSLLTDWSRVSGIDHPERYFIDPQSEASVQAQKGKAMASQKREAEQKGLITEAVQIEKIKVAADKYDGDADRAVDVWSKKVDAKIEYAKLGQEADIKEAELVAPHAADMLKEKRGRQDGSEGAGEKRPAKSGANGAA